MNERELERLVVRLMADTRNYREGMKQAEHTARKTVKQAEDTTRGIQLMTQRMSLFGFQLRGWGAQAVGVLAPLVGLTGALGAAFKGVQLAADEESMLTSFEVMIGDAKKAKELVEDIQDLAAKTPMSQAGLQASAKMLLQYGVKAENVLGVVKKMGDIAGGSQEKLMRLSLAYGQILQTGRVQGDELLQMTDAGFNPIRILAMEKAGGRNAPEAEIAKQVEALNKMKEAGQLTVKDIDRAIKLATDKGGQFFGFMEKESNTLSGLFSTMKDDVDAFLRTLGKDVAEAFNLKGFMRDVSQLAQTMTKWLKETPQDVKQMAASFVAAGASVGGLTIALLALTPAINAIRPALAFIHGLLVPIVGLFKILLNPVLLIKSAIMMVVGAMGMLGGLVSAVVASYGLILIPVAALAALVFSVVAVVVSWVDEMGGVEKAWGKIKEAAIAAWEWLKPVRRQLINLFNTIRHTLMEAFRRTRDFILKVWEDVFGQGSIDWDFLREKILIGLIALEYGIQNLGPVWDVMWKGAKYYAVSALNFLIDRFLKYGDEANKFLTNLFKNWKHTFYNIGKYTAIAVTGMAGMIIGLHLAVAKALLTTDWSKTQDEITTKIAEWIIKLDEATNIDFNLIGNKIADWDQLEKQLKREFDAAKDALGGESWEAFKKRRMEELFALDPELKNKLEKKGQEPGDSFAKGLEKGMERVDAALLKSVEGVSRIMAYREMLRGPIKSGGVYADWMDQLPGRADPKKQVQRRWGGYAGQQPTFYSPGGAVTTGSEGDDRRKDEIAMEQRKITNQKLDLILNYIKEVEKRVDNFGLGISGLAK